MGGWVRPQLGFRIYLEILCFLCCLLLLYMFQKNKSIGGWVDDVCTIRVFLGFLDFFNLTRPLNIKNTLSYLNYHSQIQVAENYSHLSNLKPNIFKS